ncbi:uncharacterized protein LOC135153423, partial [Lytechinus pictus]|uniref:uncharacterized protein LOC135153423 n=1 Tax=Lytechinus pictus TaxID=7653 RepID=UPI0030BA23ED
YVFNFTLSFNSVSCVGWCECTGAQIDISTFATAILFNSCPLKKFHGFGTCPNDPERAAIALDTGINLRNCEHLRINPLIYFKNETNGTHYALRAWDSGHPDSSVLLSEFCAPQCNPLCGLTLPPTPTPAPPMTTPMTTGRLIDIPIESPQPTEKSGSGLTSSEIRTLGIAVGVASVILLICIIALFVYCLRRNKNKNRGPKLPPRRNLPSLHNQEYATVEEIQMTSSPGRGGAYPNGLYRSESLSAINSLNSGTIHRSVSDIALLGDPPNPPVRQMSLLPGVNPALADMTDGRSAPQDAYGYTRYLPETEPQGLPYMHLKVAPSISDPENQHRTPQKPHRYRSNTGDTHANSTDVERALDRIKARQALKDGNNRRFVPNQSGRGRSSTLGEDYNRLTRGGGHRGVPRSRKYDSAAFTPVPVYGQYQSRPRRSPESVRRWRSLPDMTDGGQAPSTLQADTDSVDGNAPVYHLLERSPASSIGGYSKRETYQLPNEDNERVLPRSKTRDSRGSGRAASESGSHRSPSQGQGNTMDERYDPVYESRLSGPKVPQSPSEYQPLTSLHPEYLDFDDHPAADEALDSDSYLRPKDSKRSSKENGKLSGGRSGMHSPDAPSNGHVQHNSQDKAYIYGSDNNNLSEKKQPSRTVGGNQYAALKLRRNDDSYDNLNDEDDEMENGEYMYHPAGPDIMA